MKRPNRSTDLNRRAPALPPRARWAGRLLVGVPLTALLVATIVYFAALGRLLRAGLAPVAAAEVSRQIGHEVRLSSIDFRPGVLILNRVSVSNHKTFQSSGGEAAVVADRVTIHYRLHDLLFDSGNAGHAIGDIVVDHPTALVERLTAKTFNFSDVIDVFLKQPHKPHSKPFAGRILASNATVHFRDYMAPAGLGIRPAYNTVMDVSGTVDLSSPRTVYFVASGHGTDGRVADFSASGDASRLTAGRFRVLARVNDADAAYWSTYFKAFPQAIVKTGRADLDLIVARLGSKPSPGLPIDLSGRVTVRGGTIHLTDPRVTKVPVQNVNGTANFTGDGVTIQGTLLAAGQPARINGTVFDFLHPQLAFDASSPRLDAIRVARLLPFIKLPPGLGASSSPVTAQITGTTISPVVSVQTTIPTVTFQGNTATDVRVRALYAGQVLAIPTATFRLNGQGQGAVRVTVNTAPKIPTALIGGRIVGINLAGLHLPTMAGKPPKLGGLADVAFLADDQSRPLSVVANVSIDKPRVAQTVLRSARGRLVYSLSGGLTLSRAVIETSDGGILTASGAIPLAAHVPLNLSINAAGANLGRLLAPYSKLAVGGTAYAQARVTGPLSAPLVAGKVQLFGGRYGKIATDVVTGTVSGSADALRLQDVVVRRYPTEVKLSGTVSRIKSQNPVLALNANLSQGDLADVLSLADQIAPAARPGSKKSTLRVASSLPALTGTITGAFRITGRAQSPHIAGHVGVTDVTVDAYRLKEVRADIANAGDTVRVANAFLQTDNGATASGHGQFQTRTGRLAAAFTGRNIDLDQFDQQMQPYATVDGVLDVSGRVGGTVKSPTAAATVSARDFSAEGQTFAPFTVSGRYADGVLSKTGGPWAFTLTGGQGGPPTEYVVDALRLSLPTPTHPKRARSVTLAARVPETSPERLAHLAQFLQTSRLGKTPAGERLLAQLDSLPGSPEGTVWVPALSVDGPLDALTVQATIGASGLSLGDEQIGTFAARASYTGGPTPTAHGEVTAGALRLAGVPIQSVTAQGDYTGRVITLSRLDARSQQAYLHATGRADLDGAIDADLDASNVPLSLANLFLPPGRRVSGTVSALTVEASGQTKSPDLTASINLDSPTVTVTTPGVAPGQAATTTQYALDNIRSGTITLASLQPGTPGKVLTITDLAAYRNGHRLATLSGTLPVSGGAQGVGGLLPRVPTDRPLHADLQVTDLGVAALFAPGVIDPARTGGVLTASLDYGGGTGTAPRLLGQVNITNASFGVVGFDTGLTAMNGRVVVDDSRVTVQSFVGHTSANKKGTITVTGGGTLGDAASAGRADLHLTASDVRVDETGRQNFLAKTYNSGARGTINGTVSVTGPWTSPLVATAANQPLRVTDAVGTLPSTANAPAGPRVVPAVDPRFKVSIALGGAKKTISVRSSLLQAEASGEVDLGGRLSDPQMHAQIKIARGQFILPPTTRLKIIRPQALTGNSVDLKYPVASSDPADNGAPVLQTRVNLTVQANVAASPAVLAANQSVVSGVTGQAPPLVSSASSLFSGTRTQRYTITVQIVGLLNSSDPKQPQLLPTSDPQGLNKDQMLALLVPEGTLTGLLGGGQGAEKALKQSLAEAFSAVVGPTLLSPLEQTVAGALGLEDFSVNYSPDAPVNVTLSKQIAPRLLVTYIRALGARTSGAVNNITQPPQYQIKLGYGITDHFQFSLSTDDQKNNTAALESVFNF